jgi:hypothetical protein
MTLIDYLALGAALFLIILVRGGNKKKDKS